MGPGILCWDASPVIDSNIICYNVADLVTYGTGGGILCYSGSHATITNNTIYEDSARWGGGIACWLTSNPTISRNTITDNYAYVSGGGVYCYQGASPSIIKNEISRNTTVDAGSLLGAGIRCSQNCSPTIKHCTISENHASNITLENYSSPIIDSCTITAGTYGIRLLSGSPTIHNSNLYDNCYSVWNFQNTTIDAKLNWWGHASGPYHSTANPGGQGNRVSSYVDFNPWLTDSVAWQLGITETKITQPAFLNLQINPNPCCNRTQIRYGMRDTGYEIQDVSLKIYDATGRLVKDFAHLSVIGHQSSVRWHGDDNAGRKLPGGVYFVTLSADDQTATQKLILIR